MDTAKYTLIFQSIFLYGHSQVYFNILKYILTWTQASVCVIHVDS